MTTDNNSNPNKQLGKTMMILAWLVVLGLLVMFFSHQEEQAYNPNHNPDAQQSSQANIVTLQRNQQYHYVSKGTINTQTVTFLLDTGATHVVVPEALAQQLNLLKGPSQRVNTANGTIDVYSTKIDELTIGNITLRQVIASINPYMNGEEILLGMSALKSIEFTQRGDQLTLKQYR